MKFLFFNNIQKYILNVSLTGGYHLEVDSGSIRWFHRDSENRIIFSMMTSQVVIPRVWMHFTAVYDGYKGIARVRFFNCLLPSNIIRNCFLLDFVLVLEFCLIMY